MRHFHPFILQKVAEKLNSQLKGEILINAFSNNAQHYALIFEALHLQFIFFEEEIYFQFIGQVSASRLFNPQVKPLYGRQVLEIYTIAMDRVLVFEFDNGQKLVIKCYGRNSNILYLAEGVVQSIFVKKHKNDVNFVLPQNVITEIKYAIENTKSEQIFLKYYPYLNPEFYKKLMLDNNEDNFNELFNEETSFKSVGWGTDFNIHTKHEGNILDDISSYCIEYLKQNTAKRQIEEKIKELKKKLNAKEQYLEANKQAFVRLEGERNWEEIGNIILANATIIDNNSSKIVELIDIYNGNKIDVKINTEISTYENAELYFKKAKAKPIELEILKKKIEAAEVAFYKITEELKQWETAPNKKDIKSLQKKGEVEENLPFRKFDIDGFVVLVGKNADSNDKLLNTYSKKNDIWLHAKDVKGCHVIIKAATKGKVPEMVLLQAASIAAYYSGQKNQEWATVSHTLRQHVRKVKGEGKGKVIMQQEKTLIVKPQLI